MAQAAGWIRQRGEASSPRLATTSTVTNQEVSRGRAAPCLTDPGRVCASLAPRLGQKSLVANVVVFM